MPAAPATIIGGAMGFDPTLGALFNFDADELEQNRAGALSPDQETIRRNTVREYGRQTRRGGRLFGVALVGAAVLVAVGIANTPGGGTAAGLVAGAVLLGLVLLVAIFRRRFSRTTAALASGELGTVEGPFSWDSDLSGRWWGRVGDGPRFSIDRAQEESLVTGARYRLHYLPAGDAAWVLSIVRSDGDLPAAPEGTRGG